MPEPAQPPAILVVDDDEGLLILMAEALRVEGFEVATASSGAEALERLTERTPDLMLLDLKMRGLGGEGVLTRLQQEKLAVPFIVVTGQGDEKVAVEVMKRGALDYVMKDAAMLDLLPGITRRALTAIDRDRALRTATAERARLEREILEISENEQHRIGADLHDGLGQQLTAIELLCVGLKADVSGQPAVAKQVGQIGQRLREAIGHVRSLARGLVPVKDELDALQVSLVELVELTNQLGRVKCRLDCPEPVLIENSATASHFYRIAQEAVNNAVKHSHASGVVIALMQTGEKLELKIADNGKGFPKTGSLEPSMGLNVMRHRARVIGAELTVESKPGKGVTITCTLPTNL